MTTYFPKLLPAIAPAGSVPRANLSGLSVRRAQMADLPALSEVLASGFHSRQGLQALVYPFLRLGIYEDVRGRLQGRAPHYACLVAIAPAIGRFCDLLLGTVELSLSTSDRALSGDCCSTYISNLAVSPLYRRRGVARRLLGECDRVTREWELPEIYLHVLDTNERARQLYTGCGYRLCRREPDYAGGLFGRPQRLLMGKTLA